MTPTLAPQKQTTRALWYVDRGQVALHEEELVIQLAANDVLVEVLYSGISRGTERLILNGLVPASEHATMRAPNQAGAFPFPVKYGYCAVGIIRQGPPDLRERVAFCLYPHQERFIADASKINVVPPGIPPKRATLSGNMETALNAHWDAGTRAGDRVNVIGAGIVGLLTAFIARQFPGAEVTLIDIDPSRRALAEALGLAFAEPIAAPRDADVVFHTSASAAGLQAAIDSAAFEARIVEMSWYGDKETTIGLGGAFHAKRLQVISTQVGQVATPNRARWTYQRRMSKAISLLDDPRLDALVCDELAFDDLATDLPAVLADVSGGLPPVIRYPAAGVPRTF
ncbi:MAG: zinc-binding alcohol dehydrogenase [Pseudomonadota bacterium]